MLIVAVAGVLGGVVVGYLMAVFGMSAACASWPTATSRPRFSAWAAPDITTIC
ncbi:MAG: hypothetical protein HQL38_17620 [Alphaproteobacteria bacterium]|nr:hypothetical protein [Alphaproteobacteria bacterium]